MPRAALPHRTLQLIIASCVLVVLVRLGVAAEQTGNWWGATVSSVHTLLVACGSYLALRSATDRGAI